MKYFFHPEAKKEFLDAIDYYESCSEGLDLEFVNDVYSTIQRVIDYPHAWSNFSKNTRRCLTKQFPFGVIYQVLENKDEILVIAVMQLNRKPGYWKKRL
jgi:plasmid stabilization system protein ParE